jgi:putative SOS response-associated peptidase YedK
LKKTEATIKTVFPELQPHYNIVPSQNIPAIRSGADGCYHLVFLRWGLIPHWSKDSHSDYSTINALAETVDEKPVYRGGIPAPALPDPCQWFLRMAAQCR